MSSVPPTNNLAGSITIGTEAGGISVDDALLLVQIDRVRLCEMQLTDQINSIRTRNELMKKLNDVQTVLTEVKAKFSKTDADAKFSDIGGISEDLLDGYRADGSEIEKPFLTRMREAAKTWQELGMDPNYGAKLSGPLWSKTDFRYKDIEVMTTAVKSQLDSMSSSSQMDMVRLQSLNNKRSEAFDTMTNSLKKQQDNKSSIVGNFR
jgi:hypothetical protein